MMRIEAKELRPEDLRDKAASLEEQGELATISGRITEGMRLIERAHEMHILAFKAEKAT